MDRVRSLQKIPTQLCGTNFCTCSAHFAPSFVRQPNGPQCTQIEQNAPKHQFWVQWGGSGAFVAKNSYATSCTNFCTSSARFCTEFHNATKRSSTHPNRTKRTKTLVLGPLGWIGYVRCEKFRRDFVAQTFTLVRPVLPRVS